MTVVAPADPSQTRSVLRATLDMPGPVYIRIGKGNNPEIPGLNGRFTPGRPELVRRGTGRLYLATGSIAREAVGAAELLAREEGRTAVAVLAHLPFTASKQLAKLLARFSEVVTVEEGFPVGGVARWRPRPSPWLLPLSIGCARELGGGAVSGSPDYLRGQAGLTARELATLESTLRPTAPPSILELRAVADFLKNLNGDGGQTMECRDLGQLGLALWGTAIAWMLALLALSLYLPHYRTGPSPSLGVIPAYAGLSLDNRPTKHFFAAFFLLGSGCAYLASRSKLARRLNGLAAWFGIALFVPVASRYTSGHVFARQAFGWRGWRLGPAFCAGRCHGGPFPVTKCSAAYQPRRKRAECPSVSSVPSSTWDGTVAKLCFADRNRAEIGFVLAKKAKQSFAECVPKQSLGTRIFFLD